MQSSYRIIKGVFEAQEQSKKIIPIIKVENYKSKKEIMGKDKGITYIESPIEKARNEADAIIEKALQEAEMIKKDITEKSEKEAKVILESLKKTTYKEAYTEGFEKGTVDGKKEGNDKANQECQLVRKQAKMVLENAHLKSQEIIEKTQTDIINLAVDIAKNLMSRMKLEDNSVLIDMARNAFVELKNKEQIIINIHPTNKDLFIAHMDEIKEICPKASFVILEDSAMDPIGCRLESDTATIDTQVSRQLSKIKEALLEMRTSNEV